MTHEEVAKLTDEEIVIAVLKAIGFERADEWKVMTNEFVDSPTWDAGFLLTPNYPQDLNACHAMEKCLTDEQWGKYTAHLLDIVSEHIDKENARLRSVCYCSATARRRCNAFVMTMTEENP